MSFVRVEVCEGNWGNWHGDVVAPNGCYVDGICVRYEAPIGSGDDTALNGIQMHVSSLPGRGESSNNVVVHPGHWGNWRPWVYAPDGYYIAGMRARFEPWQRGGDDTALNGIEAICCSFQNNAIKRVMVEKGNWGEWGPDAMVPLGWCVAGLQVRVESPIGSGDDTAMNGIRLLARPIG